MSPRDKFAPLPAWKHGLALKYVEELSGAFADVIIERVQQDEQWGGPATDDTRTPADWAQYTHHQLSKMFQEEGGERERFVKVAALAFAAIAAIDRANPQAAPVCECPVCKLEAFMKDLGGNGGVEVVEVDSMATLVALLSGLTARKRGQPG